MNFGMYANARIIQAIKCSVCGQKDGHAPGCLQVQLDYLDSRRLHITCPTCFENAVALNSDDYFECRKCHTQYSTSPVEENAPTTLLDDPTHGDLRTVAILSQKGRGDFPLDKQIDEVVQRIRSMAKKPRRRKKKLQVRHFLVTAETLLIETKKSRKGTLEHKSGPALSKPQPTVAVYGDRVSLVNWGKFSLAPGEHDYGVLKEFVANRLQVKDSKISFVNAHDGRKLRIVGLVKK